MTSGRFSIFLASAAVTPLIALAVVAAGSGASASAAPAKATSPLSVPGGVASRLPQPTVQVRNTRLGKILVNSRGQTLYLFKKDSGKKSKCFGACANAWPPLRANGKPTVGSGAHASMVGTTARSDGARQVTYNGHPVYLFSDDQRPGDTNGEGLTAFGGRWYAVSPAGNQVSG
jgi:predicted lipoprotein with Yx(FWY)xxD motif